MSKVEELEKILKDDFMPEIEENINDLMDLVDEKDKKDDKEELEYVEDLKNYFDDVLLDIDNKTLKEEDAIEILAVLEEMQLEN